MGAGFACGGKTQLGYHASDANYTVSDDGTRNAYSRYGEWAGAPYGTWNSDFAAFSLHYAGIPDDAVQEWKDTAEWFKCLEKAYSDALTEDVWQPGDLVFLDRDGDGEADTAAFAEKLLSAEEDAPERVKLIAGDMDGAVRHLAVPLPLLYRWPPSEKTMKPSLPNGKNRRNLWQSPKNLLIFPARSALRATISR